MAHQLLRPRLSIIILANNSEGVIREALESAKWSPELIVVDTNINGSSDNTIKISKEFTDKIYSFKTGSFSDWRNKAFKLSKGVWVFYLDADERITFELQEELLKISNTALKDTDVGVYDVSRRNYYLGKKWHQGDSVTRLFYKNRLVFWKGELHETPIVRGKLGKLIAPINHWTHTDIDSMITKTLKWSKIEGKLLFDSGHPPMYWWRFPRVMVQELCKRLIVDQYWKDGIEGWIEAIFQMFSVFLTYVRLWEFQNNRLKNKD